jgi:hypothetical protein
MQQGIPAILVIDQYPQVLQQETDTATPRSVIPIFYIHSLQQPWCKNAACACQRGKSDAARWFGNIHENTLVVAEAAPLIAETKGEK